MQFKTMLAGLTGAFLAAPAMAQDLPVIGRPHDAGIGFQPAATRLAERLQWLDGMTAPTLTPTADAATCCRVQGATCSCRSR